ncbi:MAG TPA: alpha/beta hydrolase [Candidatus Dormibacteraeota bacterium]|jgi:pimeloyl-ACP methyl ester carboxylesterase
MSTSTAIPTETTSYLTRPSGRIAFDVDGQGPLVVLVPGMGDLRSTFRSLAPSLRVAGYRVASTDLRGQGDSDATFDSYGDPETAGDVIALLEELGGRAVIVGNSMGAAAAVIVAAERTELVRGIVLIGPFVRNGKSSAMQRLLQRAAMTPLWAAAAWKSYLPKLYAGRRPDDFEAYRSRVIASLRLPGHAKAFSRITRTSHDPAEARLSDVKAPTLVVMGELDPDFPDPKAEAEWIGGKLHGEAVMVPEAGHYPQSQRPDLTTNAVLRFLATLGDSA